MAAKYFFGVFVLCCVFLSTVDACLKLVLTADGFDGPLIFTQLSIDETKPLELQTGRAAYVAKDNESAVYIYHTVFSDGNARWILNTNLGGDEDAMAYSDSWAIAPHLTGFTADEKHNWNLFSSGSWQIDPSFELRCGDVSDDNIYFESSLDNINLAGFYMVRQSENPFPVYSMIKLFPGDEQMYLYRFNDKWLIGDEVGVDSCVAFVESDAEKATDIKNVEWRFLGSDSSVEGEEVEWNTNEAIVVTRVQVVGDEEMQADNIYDALRYRRSIKFIPEGQTYLTLRNELPIPTLGLGTGGMQGGDEVTKAVTYALREGYRMIDTAREYGNEQEIGQTIRNHMLEEDMPLRSEVFIQSKVWPTQLGFEPTTEAVEVTLRNLGTEYVDMYLIHWPK